MATQRIQVKYTVEVTQYIEWNSEETVPSDDNIIANLDATVASEFDQYEIKSVKDKDGVDIE